MPASGPLGRKAGRQSDGLVQGRGRTARMFGPRSDKTGFVSTDLRRLGFKHNVICDGREPYWAQHLRPRLATRSPSSCRSSPVSRRPAINRSISWPHQHRRLAYGHEIQKPFSQFFTPSAPTPRLLVDGRQHIVYVGPPAHRLRRARGDTLVRSC